MQIQALRKWIQLGEHDTLEFKRTISSAYKIARTIVSLANNKGGVLLIGVDDTKKICGCNPTAETRIINQANSYYCEPTVDLFIEEIIYEEYAILKITIPESYQKPHFVINEDGKKQAYIRVNDESMQASKTTLKAIELGNNSNKLHLDNRTAELIQYLQHNKRITALQFSRMMNFSKHRSEKFLYDLSIKGVLREHTHAHHTYYTLS